MTREKKIFSTPKTLEQSSRHAGRRIRDLDEELLLWDIFSWRKQKDEAKAKARAARDRGDWDQMWHWMRTAAYLTVAIAGAVALLLL